MIKQDILENQVNMIYIGIGSNLGNKLKNIEFSWLLLSMGFGAIAIISRGVRWIYLIKALGYNSSIKNSVNSVAVGYLTNILIPRAGEISRCTSLQQVENIPFNKLFGTIILERVIDFAILIALILISFLYPKMNHSAKITEPPTGVETRMNLDGR